MILYSAQVRDHERQLYPNYLKSGDYYLFLFFVFLRVPSCLRGEIVRLNEIVRLDM